MQSESRRGEGYSPILPDQKGAIETNRHDAIFCRCHAGILLILAPRSAGRPSGATTTAALVATTARAAAAASARGHCRREPVGDAGILPCVDGRERRGT